MKQGFALCALFSAALMFAACDSGSSSADATTTATPTASTDPSTDPATTPPSTPTTHTLTSEQLSLTLTFQGPAVSPLSVYACWLEDESGKDIQNVYICNRVVGIDKTLTGDALPYWKTVKYKELAAIDGVTGSSTQGDKGLAITRTIPIGSPAKFRACFEIDRSNNANTYFGDRPSFIYKSAFIDAASLSSDPYALTLVGWMSNDTGIAGGSYSQQPKSGVTIDGFAPYAYMTELSWIAPVDDMVSLLTVKVTKP